MAIREILKIGNPLLRERSRELTEDQLQSPQLKELISDMFETMRAARGVGLAAPQVGELVRVVVLDIRPNPRYPYIESTGELVLVNPVLTPTGNGRDLDWEGCLSVDGLRGRVPRWTDLSVTFRLPGGERHHLGVSGFLARAIQHECDHLDGILWLDRTEDTRSITQIAEFEKYVLPSLLKMPAED